MSISNSLHKDVVPGKERGLITIAYGRKKYLEQALSLARSVRYHNVSLPMALVTDRQHANYPGLERLFDHVIEWDFSEMAPFVYKLHLDRMSPFQETLYVDSDCLCTGSLEPVFSFFSGQPFSILKQWESTEAPHWFYDSEAIRKKFNLESFQVFNGGLFNFVAPSCTEIFDAARKLLSEYDDLNIKPHCICDEALLSIVLGTLGITCTRDPGTIMNSMAGLSGRPKVSVFKGMSRFLKYAETVTPVLVHFGSKDGSYTFRREVGLLAKWDKNGKPPGFLTTVFVRLTAYSQVTRSRFPAVLRKYFLASKRNAIDCIKFALRPLLKRSHKC